MYSGSRATNTSLRICVCVCLCVHDQAQHVFRVTCNKHVPEYMYMCVRVFVCACIGPSLIQGHVQQTRPCVYVDVCACVCVCMHRPVTYSGSRATNTSLRICRCVCVCLCVHA